MPTWRRLKDEASNCLSFITPANPPASSVESVALPYDYNQCPLRTGRPETRVLELLPGTFESDVRVRLSTVPLRVHRTLPYTALSYTWGSQYDPEKIYVIQAREPPRQAYLSVTRNLAVALRHLRDSRRKKTFWIDAICINQANSAERSQQVQHMALIYCQARRVTIWLGPERDNSTYALAVLRWWADKANFDFEKMCITPKASRKGNPVEAWEANDMCGSARVTETTNALVSREWFTRAWVRQEVSLAAHRSFVQCGHERMPWLDFESAFCCLCRYEVESGLDFSGSQRTQRILNIRLLHNRYSLSFVSLLAEGRALKCYDPRDKVFSALGMIKAEESCLLGAIKPDYTISYDELRIRVSMTIANRTRSLEILEACDVGQGSRKMPTWAPDWTEEKAIFDKFPTLYAAGPAFPTSIRSSGAVLHLIAVSCGKIEGVRRWPFRLTTNRITPWQDGVAELRALYREFSSQSPINESSGMIASLAHDLCVFELLRVPAGITDDDTVEADIGVTTNVLTTILVLEDDQVDQAVREDPQLKSHIEWLLDRAAKYSFHRSLALTDRSHIPLAPRHTECGDELMVVLGLRLPAVLRPQADGSYRFIGTSYTHGFNYGEAFLGTLPPDWRYTRELLPNGTFYDRFKRRATGETTYLAPRVKRDELKVDGANLPDRYISDGGRYFKTLDEEYLLRHGVEIKTIRIV